MQGFLPAYLFSCGVLLAEFGSGDPDMVSAGRGPCPKSRERYSSNVFADARKRRCSVRLLHVKASHVSGVSEDSANGVDMSHYRRNARTVVFDSYPVSFQFSLTQRDGATRECSNESGKSRNKQKKVHAQLASCKLGHHYITTDPGFEQVLLGNACFVCDTVCTSDESKGIWILIRVNGGRR